MKILIIEDDNETRDYVSTGLKEAGHSIDSVSDGYEGLLLAKEGKHDLLIVDRMLPDLDGLTLVKTLRSAGCAVPVLFLTTMCGIDDRVEGLNAGADDYLGKPFSFDELIARIHSLGRRFSDPSASAWELRVGNLVMNLRVHSVRRGDQVLNLTPKEWSLLEYLMRHPGQSLTRQNILDYVWSYESEVQPTMVDVYISYLRDKLHQPGLKDPIQTRRGVGYSLEPDHA